MKTITVLFAIFVAQFIQAQVDHKTTITVVVENLKSNEGTVIAGLYTETTFLKAAPELSATAKIENGTATLHFENVTPGMYGITVFHDKNSNNQIDFEASGMPMEEYGISNNKFNPYGPPVWSDARFMVEEEDLEFNIRLSR